MIDMRALLFIMESFEGNFPKLYHGTNNLFSDFSDARIGTGVDNNPFTGNVGMLGKGFYFSPSFNKASEYGDVVYTVKIKIKNPLFIGKGTEFKSVYDYFEKTMNIDVQRNEFQNKLSSLGFDGIVYRDYWYNDLDEYVVFNKNDIEIVDRYIYE